MYTRNKLITTSLTRNKSTQGETLEHKVSRIINNKEPIKDGAQKIYTERKDGVLPAYNIRTDRMEMAAEAMTKASKSHIGKRMNRIGEQAQKGMEIEKKGETGGQSSQATE